MGTIKVKRNSVTISMVCMDYHVCIGGINFLFYSYENEKF